MKRGARIAVARTAIAQRLLKAFGGRRPTTTYELWTRVPEDTNFSRLCQRPTAEEAVLLAEYYRTLGSLKQDVRVKQITTTVVYEKNAERRPTN